MNPGPAHFPRGCVNAHTHIYSGLVPFGLPDPPRAPRDFGEILSLKWWRLDRALDRDALRASARVYVADALLHGTTTLIDHHESPDFIEGSLDVLADACEEMGMRAVLCYGATERNGGRDEARRGLAECRRFIRDNTRPGVRGAIGLHASFTVSDETLEEAGALARELDTVVHVHMAEDTIDVHDAHRRGYHGPLERLLETRALPAGSILAHGVHLSEAQVRRAEAHRLWLVQNPRSNEGNAVGYPQALWASHRVALGTDGYPADMRAELAALARLAGEHSEHEPTGATTIARRLEAGHALVAERFGGRAEADAVDAAAQSTAHVCLAERVEIDGRVVVENGRLTGADLDEIRAEARAQAARLGERIGALP